MKCTICSREAQEGSYCSLHYMAYMIIVQKYKVWQRASNLSWGQYLSQIQKNSLTGEWAKDVAKHLIEEEEADGRKNKENV